MLKGVTGNIGADALYGKVAAIDARLKQGALPETAELNEMRSLLEQVVHDIDSLDASATAASTPAAAPLAPDQVQNRLERLAHALAYDLGAVEPLLDDLRKGVAGTPLESEIAAIAALVDVFDIDTALAHLNTLEIPGQSDST